MANIKPRDILLSRQNKGNYSSSNNISNNDTWKNNLLRNKRTSKNTSVLEFIQNPIGIVGGSISNTLQGITSGEFLSDTKLEGLSLSSGTLSYTKFWRYKLLMKNSNMEKSEYSPRPKIKDNNSVYKKLDNTNIHTTKDLSEAESNSLDLEKIKARRSSSDSFTPTGRNYIEERFKALESIPKNRKNDIIIINPSIPYQAIILQNRPDELRIEPKTTWASISSVGRNNPFMMYIGGEDTVSFDISWFANDPSRRDEVLYKCKLLERWSKADGYNAGPPLLKISWGSSGIFDNDYFILESASYVLSHFQDRSWKNGKDRNSESIQDLKLYPNCATQSLIFKRVTPTNLTHEEIVPLSKIEGLNGIKLIGYHKD